jgi:ATP-binding protein involved in chromosome partitioning
VPLTEEAVLGVLKNVMDPDLRRDIVSLGFIKNLVIDGGNVSFSVELTTPACPVKDQLKQECIDEVTALPGVEAVEVEMTAQVRVRQTEPQDLIPGVRHAIAIASG